MRSGEVIDDSLVEQPVVDQAWQSFTPIISVRDMEFAFGVADSYVSGACWSRGVRCLILACC